MLTEAEIESIRANRFRLNCPRINLHQRDAKGERYDGSGFVEQTASGQFLITVMCSQDALRSQRSVDPANWGKLLDHEKYFELEAEDMKGRAWKTVVGGVSTSLTLASQHMEVRVEVSQLEFRRPVEKRLLKSSVQMHFFGPIIIPYTIVGTIEEKRGERIIHRGSHCRAHKLEVSGCSITIEKSDDEQTTSVSLQGSNLPAFFENRILETLRLVTGRELWPCVVKKTEGAEESLLIRTSHESLGRPIAATPIWYDAHHHTSEFWYCFEKTLQFLSSYTGKEFHPFTQWHRLMILGYDSTINVRQLNLAVAIEGLVHEAFPNRGLPAPERLHEVEDAKAKIEQLEISKRLKSSLLSSLGNFNRSTAKNKLFDLANDKLVVKEHVDKWNSLRGKSVHKGDHYEELTQETLDAINTLQVLFYHLVFAAVGYDGKYTDYSRPGYKTLAYPPKSDSQS